MSIDFFRGQIKHTLNRSRQILRDYEKDGFIMVISLAGLLVAFGLGKMSVYEAQSQQVSVTAAPGHTLVESKPWSDHGVMPEGGVVASKKGSKYHLPWCGGAQRMNEENKIWFDTIEAAQAAGYTAAKNCPGLK